MLHFSDRTVNFFSLSLIVHLVFISIFFLFSYVQINFFDNNLNYVSNNFDTINVNLVEMDSKNPSFASSAHKAISTLDKSGYIKSNSAGTNTYDSTHQKPSSKSAEKESKRYEYILSQQFTKLSPLINDLFSELERINLWIKIDKEGNIIDSGAAENIPLSQFIQIKQAITQLSPLPKPPQTNIANQELQQYLIPILIK